MKKIKCTIVKNYKITEGNEYDVIKETDDYYFLINDTGKTVKYSKDLFEEVAEDIPEVVVARTEEDMIASLAYNNGTVTYADLEGEIRTNQLGDLLGISESTISCGIKQIAGINNLVNTISRFVPTDDDYLDLRKAILRLVITEKVLRRTGAAMYIMSTNLNTPNNNTQVYVTPEMKEVLDELGTVTDTVMNPNSHRNIAMWTFYTA